MEQALGIGHVAIRGNGKRDRRKGRISISHANVEFIAGSNELKVALGVLISPDGFSSLPVRLIWNQNYFYARGTVLPPGWEYDVDGYVLCITHIGYDNE